MKKRVIQTAAIIGFAVTLGHALPAMAEGSKPSITLNASQFAFGLNNQIKPDAKAFGLWGALLDMGARANGTLKNASGKHQAWCAKFHRSYDAQSNTYAQFNGKRRACVSPYG